MIKSQTMNVAGHKAVQYTRNCVRKSLTEEAQDIARESIEDFLYTANPEDLISLSHAQNTLIDCLKYYVGDTVEQYVNNCHVIGDSRNNDPKSHGHRFEVEIAFTVKNALIPTKITYVIEYKQ